MTASMLGRVVLCFVLLGFALPGPARAEPTEAERMTRWSDLRHAIFGDRVVEDARDLVAIDAPTRAHDAAIVPVAIRVAETFAPQIRGFYLIIDDNPSPLAAHFLLGPIADAREIATRVRIDDYTYLHAVVETEDGRL
jgi:sulfur-oxidizing protein SoxY